MPWLLAPLLLLGGLVVATSIASQRLEDRFPPIGRFMERAGVRVHYTDSGPGSREEAPVVLIHGASTSLLDFHASLVEPLTANHRVITVDRPGHGYSDRPDGLWPDPAEQARIIHGLLDALGVEQPILVGHSWAGSLVLAYLLDYPHAALGAVLLAGGSHAWEGGVAWYNDLAGVPLLGALFAHSLPLTAGRLTIDAGINSVFAPDPVPPDYRERTGVELTLRPQTFISNAEDIRLLSPFLEQQSSHYSFLQHPLLLITGDADDIVPAWNHAERLVRQAPNTQLVVFEDTGHALHHVHAERIAALIDNFAREARQ
ncbi:MAG: alpha/beta hydrolase [Thiohalocapsa sp.]